MAADNTPGSAGESSYVEELNKRHARFIALGGTKDLQMEMQGWTPLKDLVTPLHRQIVFDLASSGLSNEMVADVVGISKERLQKLFPVELNTAFQLCHASMSRNLYRLGLAGDEKATTSWLIHHNLGKWGKKTQLAGPEGGPIQTEDSTSKELLTKLLAGMATDPKLKGRKVDKDAPRVDKSQPKVANKGKKAKQIKRVRSEDETMADGLEQKPAKKA